MPRATVWYPAQYHQYSELRLRPAVDLFSRVFVEAPKLVHDIGTGGGEIARRMTTRWPEARVIGSDSSEEMLAKARSVESLVEWRYLDVATWRPDPEHDVIFANAVLHWIDDHAELIPRLMTGLVPGGQLAVQMPMSWWQPSNEVVRETLATLQSSEASVLAAQMASPNVHEPADYYAILRPLATRVDIWDTTYQQVLTGEDPVFEWISGAILRPVFSRLPGHEVAEFSDRCRQALRRVYPTGADGTTLFPFRRIFFVAQR